MGEIFDVRAADVRAVYGYCLAIQDPAPHTPTLKWATSKTVLKQKTFSAPHRSTAAERHLFPFEKSKLRLFFVKVASIVVKL